MLVHIIFQHYLAESYIVTDGFTDIKDVGFLVQDNEKTINGLH